MIDDLLLQQSDKYSKKIFLKYTILKILKFEKWESKHFRGEYYLDYLFFVTTE